MATKIGEILPGVIEKITRGMPIKVKKLLPEFWEELIGKETASHTRIKGLKRGTLNVLVDSSPHLSYLLMEKEKILTQLKKTVAGIKEIKFRAR